MSKNEKWSSMVCPYCGSDNTVLLPLEYGIKEPGYIDKKPRKKLRRKKCKSCESIWTWLSEKTLADITYKNHMTIKQMMDREAVREKVYGVGKYEVKKLD